ncbi:MAG TPA: peptidylprolyl isomerase [Gammaproteobacteria bacterium]|nr:peptidylprolyl isomerase [Gammaproteobacteria bacterium]
MKRLLLLPLLFALAAHASEAPGTLLDRIVAVVNDNVIMQSELEEETARMRDFVRARGAALPPEDIFRRQILDRMIAVELQLQFAQRAGITVSDDRVNMALAQIAANNKVNLSELPRVLAQQGIDYATFRESVREELILQEVRRRAVESRVTVSPREVEELVERQQREGAGQEFLTSHILIAVPGEAPPERLEAARQQAEDIRNRVLAGEASFADMAVSFSQGQQALEGGSLGWRRLPEMPTLFADAVAGMKPGEITPPIRSGSGWHLLRLDDVRGRERVVATETHVRHILLKPNALRDQAETMAFARELRRRIAEGANFAELAREHSEDPSSAVQGGDLGWTPPGVFVPRFQEVVDELQPGTLSEPFETQFGIHIAEVLGRRETDFTDTVAQNRAYQVIRQRKAEEQYPLWLQREHDNAHIEIRLGGE